MCLCTSFDCVLCSFSLHDRKYTRTCANIFTISMVRNRNSHIAAELRKKVSIWEKHKEKKQLGVKPTKPFKEGQNICRTIQEGVPIQTNYQNLAVFVGAGNVSNTLVQSKVFRSLVNVLDPRYPIPMYVPLSKEVDMLVLEMKAKIQSYLVNATSLSLSVDVWTKKKFTSSYLGITSP